MNEGKECKYLDELKMIRLQNDENLVMMMAEHIHVAMGWVVG